MIRGLDVRTGVLPRTHGSALFTRGETQALVTATLGTARDAQVLDELMGERTDTFLFHYNFPPYSVGETGMVGSPEASKLVTVVWRSAACWQSCRIWTNSRTPYV